MATYEEFREDRRRDQTKHNAKRNERNRRLAALVDAVEKGEVWTPDDHPETSQSARRVQIDEAEG